MQLNHLTVEGTVCTYGSYDKQIMILTKGAQKLREKEFEMPMESSWMEQIDDPMSGLDPVSLGHSCWEMEQGEDPMRNMDAYKPKEEHPKDKKPKEHHHVHHHYHHFMPREYK